MVTYDSLIILKTKEEPVCYGSGHSKGHLYTKFTNLAMGFCNGGLLRELGPIS